MKDKLIVVGLTGGIASGKSTVARFYRDAGVPVLDADELGHFVLEPDGEAYSPVVERFGTDILDDQGRIDRQKLGGKVFGNSAERIALEALTHPAIARLAKRGLELIAESGARLAVYEAALLVETGVFRQLDALIVVACGLEHQLRRVMARDRLSKEAAAVRIAAQLPLAEKVAVADYVIQNDGELVKTRELAMKVLDQMRARFKMEGP